MVAMAALVLVPCLGFQPTASTPSLRKHNSCADACSSSSSRSRSVTATALAVSGTCRSSLRSVATQVRARKSKEDLMEKILPLIESVTASREMVPSDLTRGYDGYAFPGPLTPSEVGVVSGGGDDACEERLIHRGRVQRAPGRLLGVCGEHHNAECSRFFKVVAGGEGVCVHVPWFMKIMTLWV